jgi:uncharacterized protein YbaR (Trm112 family)
MPLSQELLSILVCPQCRGDLRYSAEADTLTCDACALRYPVVEGVPVMLPEEAEKLPRP